MKVLTILITLSVVSAMQGGEQKKQVPTCKEIISHFVDTRQSGSKKALLYQCATEVHPTTKVEEEVVLGEGGFGVVYKVIQVEDGQEFAMKFEKIGNRKEEELNREYTLMLQKKSPCDNLMHAYTRRITKEWVATVMDLLDSDLYFDLYKYFAQKYGVANADHVAEVFHGILKGVDFIHQSNWVHSDLKPENIGLMKGVPKVIDLGLMAKKDDEVWLRGTPGYIDPSALAGIGALKSGQFKASETWDMFALGVILYEMITNKNFMDNFKGHIQNILNSGKENLMTFPLPKGTPLPLVRLVVGLVNFYPQKRMTMAEALEIMKNYKQESNLVLTIDRNFSAHSKPQINKALFGVKRASRILLGRSDFSAPDRLLV